MASNIWIELEKPTSQSRAEEQCSLANKMLAKLGDTNGDGFFCMKSRSGRLTYCYGVDMDYVDLPKNGRWFNLDYFARDAVTKAPGESSEGPAHP